MKFFAFGLNSFFSGMVSHGKTFFCCQCGFGPMNSDLYAQCIGCGAVPCYNCVWEHTESTEGTSELCQPRGAKDPRDPYGHLSV